MASINEPPVLSGLDGDQADFIEGGAAVRLDAGADTLIADTTTNRFVSKVVATGFVAPSLGETLPDGSGRIIVAELIGRVHLLDPETGATTLLLDVSSETGSGGEQGFFGVALAPDFATSGTFYVSMTNLEGDNEVRRYQTASGNPDVTDPASMDVILKVPHPATLHNGGWIGFGPDGYLYVSTGDGAQSQLVAQDPNSIRGKILRIDVSADDFSGDPLRDYAIPSDNPFAAGGGLPEVWVMGLRNPYRAHFDPTNGNLYIGDVGGAVAEEVNLIRPGESGLNFGWPNREGTSGAGPDGDYTPPVIEYLRRPGATAIAGGVVYHGPIESLDGKYIFGDIYGSPTGVSTIWSVAAGSLVQGSTVQESSFANLTAALAPNEGPNALVLSYQQDAEGSLYISRYDGVVVRVSEGGDASFAGGRLTVAITGNKVAGEDSLRIDTSGAVALSNGTNFASTIRVDGQLIGMIAQNGTGKDSNDLIIDFTSGATLPRVEALLHAIGYLNTNSGNPSTSKRTVTFTLKDGLDTSAGGGNTVVVTTTVTVTGVDDPATARDDVFSTDEATVLVGNLATDNGNGVDIDADGIVIAAVNGSAAAVNHQITLASGALLTVNSDGTFTYDTNGAFDALVSSASGASNTAAQDSFTYALVGAATATVTIDITGLTSANNTLIGTSATDMLDGRLFDPARGTRANDFLIGLDGDDHYWVEGRDQVFESRDGGNDTVYAASDWTLGAGQFIELLTGVPGSVASIALTGNELDNLIVGTPGANRLDGGVGNDRLEGGAGADQLLGGDGDDRLDGGAGVNVLSGGNGNDTVIAGKGANSVDGGAGTDTLVLPGVLEDYFVVAEGTGWKVVGPSHNTLVTGVEEIVLGVRMMSMADFAARAFDGLRYIAGFPDLIAAIGANAEAGRLHWGAWGEAEGRSLTAFDPFSYLASYSDLLNSYGADTQAASRHFITHGFEEGRPISFDGYRYLASNTDLLGTFGSDAAAATRHYVEQGLAEGRQITFDGLQYLAANVDLLGTIDATNAARHYVEQGFEENRPTTFDGLRYLASYSDLLSGYGKDVVAATNHYILWGHDEGRTNTFDPVAYLLSNSDLANAGLGVDGSLRHWVKWGFAEGRLGDALFGREQTSHELAVDGSASDTLAVAGDRDWFQIELAAAEQIELTLDATGFDGTLKVYNGLGQSVAFTDAGGPDPNDASLLFTASAAGVYYVVVDSLAHSAVSTYVLTADPAII